MIGPTRILFQAPNHVGIGHITRLLAIAMRLRSFAPQIYTPFLVDGSSHGLAANRGIPSFNLPLLQELGSPLYEWMSASEKADLLRSLAGDYIETIKPAAVVFDCFPSLPLLEECLARGIPIVFCLRKVRDFDLYSGQYRVRLALQHASLLIVAHWREELCLPSEIELRAHYVGLITQDLPDDPISISLQLGISDRPVIVLTAGGGGHVDVIRYFNFVIDALRIVYTESSPFTALLLAGPLFDRWSELTYTEFLRVWPSHPRSVDAFATADLVISQGGYNSLAELGSLGTPTICIPADCDVDDQLNRTERFVATYSTIHSYAGNMPVQLAELIKNVMAEKKPRERKTAPAGAQMAAMLIYELLNSKASR